MARGKSTNAEPDDLEAVRVELLKARGAYLGALRASPSAPDLADLAAKVAALERRRAEIAELVTVGKGEAA